MLTDYQKAQIRQETEMAEKQKLAIAVLASIANNFGDYSKGLNNAFVNQHRTLQQGMGGLIFSIIKDSAKHYTENNTMYFDGRNDQFGRYCAEIDRHMTEQLHENWNKLACI